MSDLPPPDVIDARGRMRRLVLAFVIASVVGAIAYVVADGLAKPDAMPGGFDGGSQSRAFGFVFYVTGFAFAGSFALALVIQNHFAKRKWQHEQIPKAKIKR